MCKNEYEVKMQAMDLMSAAMPCRKQLLVRSGTAISWWKADPFASTPARSLSQKQQPPPGTIRMRNGCWA